MDDSTVSLQAASHRLNLASLPAALCVPPLEVLSIRYIEIVKERSSLMYTPGRHRHTFIEVHAPVCGEQTYQFGGEFCQVRPGGAMIILPYTEHSLPYSSEDLRKFAISFSFLDGECAPELLWIRAALNAERGYCAVRSEKVVPLFEAIFREASEARQGWLPMARLLVAQLVMELARAARPDARDEDARLRPRESSQRVQIIERFVRDNLALPMTGEQISNYMHLSVKQINRDVRAERALTLSEMIDGIKLSEAQKRLKLPEYTVRQAGEALGYSDASSFNRFFKRLCGVTPAAYKRMSQQEEC